MSLLLTIFLFFASYSFAENFCEEDKCKNLFAQTCNSFESQRDKFDKRMERHFQNLIQQDEFLDELCRFVDSNLQYNIPNDCTAFNKNNFIKNVKENKISNCYELDQASFKRVPVEEQEEYSDHVIQRYCDYYLSKIARENIPLEKINNVSRQTNETRNMYLKEIPNDPLLRKYLMAVKVVPGFEANSFHFGVRSKSDICSSVRGDPSLSVCSDEEIEGLNDQAYLCPRGKVYLPKSQLEFVLAHEFAHLVRNKNPSFMNGVVDNIIARSPRISSFLKEDENKYEGRYEEIAADIIASHLLNKSGKDMSKYNDYFCDLSSAKTFIDEYYPTENKYLHARDRMELLMCPITKQL